MSSNNPPNTTIIIGGGIIGLSTAYYLSLQQPELAKANGIHILDSAPSLLLSASGYAGGFLAKDWYSPGSASLGELSFRLHRELAETHDGHRKWGYADCTAYSLSVDDIGVNGKKSSGKDWLLEGTSRADVAEPEAIGNSTAGEGGAKRDEMLNEDGTPAWITRQEGGTLETISSDHGCAQVEPKELCEFLIGELEGRGVKIHLSAKATGVSKDGSGKVNGLEIKNENGTQTMPCKNIVITSGAWSSAVLRTLFPRNKARVTIKPLAGYSLVVRSPRYSKPILDPSKHTREGDTGMCHSVFCAPGAHWSFAPEAISRMTKAGRPEIYVAGLNDSNMPLPPDVTALKEMADEEKAEELKQAVVRLTGLSREGEDLVDDDLEVVRHGLCMRPISNTGIPVVGKIDPKQLGPDVELSEGSGVFFAAGHGPWGISLSLGTGLVMSELLQGMRTSADIHGLGFR